MLEHSEGKFELYFPCNTILENKKLKEFLLQSYFHSKLPSLTIYAFYIHNRSRLNSDYFSHPTRCFMECWLATLLSHKHISDLWVSEEDHHRTDQLKYNPITALWACEHVVCLNSVFKTSLHKLGKIIFKRKHILTS